MRKVIWGLMALCSSTFAVEYKGINLGAAAFASQVKPAKHGTNYLWATPQEVAMFKGFGFNIIRVPFLMERVMPSVGVFNLDELGRMDAVVNAAKSSGMVVILDAHNFGKYNDELIGSEATKQALNAFWVYIGNRYKSKENQHVWLGIMNEPYKQGVNEWRDIIQETTRIIRSNDIPNKLLISGTFYSSAPQWTKPINNEKNSEAFALGKFTDPLNNFAIELHTYFDKNNSGTESVCVSANVGVERIKEATEWLKKNKYKGFLGEFGAAQNKTCQDALNKTIQYMDKNSGAWLGWSYWAAASWLGNYPYNAYPQLPDSLKTLQRNLK